MCEVRGGCYHTAPRIPSALAAPGTSISSGECRNRLNLQVYQISSRYEIPKKVLLGLRWFFRSSSDAMFESNAPPTTEAHQPHRSKKANHFGAIKLPTSYICSLGLKHPFLKANAPIVSTVCMVLAMANRIRAQFYVSKLTEHSSQRQEPTIMLRPYALL